MTISEPILPFTGIKVLSFAQLAQGPASVQLLADLGADVVKVERPGSGSLERTYRLRNGESLLFQMLHRNQKSLTLDLKSVEGKAIILKLVEGADVLVENFRPGVMDRLGLGYQDLSRVNPRLVYLSASGFGPDGPYVSRPGQDLILQGMTGLASATGKRTDLPTPTGASVIDFHSAALNAFSMAAALLHREKTGKGQHITTSLLDAAAHLQTENIFDSANGIHKVRSTSGLASPGAEAPYGIYETADGHISLSDVSTAALSDALDEPRIAEFSKQDAFTRRDELHDIVAERMKQRTSADWLQHLLSKGIWCGPVQGYEELLEDPQFTHNELLFETEHPRLGRLRNIRSPVTMSEAPTSLHPRRMAPEVGQHTDEVLTGIGLSAEKIASLRAAKIV